MVSCRAAFVMAPNVALFNILDYWVHVK